MELPVCTRTNYQFFTWRSSDNTPQYNDNTPEISHRFRIGADSFPHSRPVSKNKLSGLLMGTHSSRDTSIDDHPEGKIMMSSMVCIVPVFRYVICCARGGLFHAFTRR